ncbi:hypothetical protein J5J83_06015 [Azoarcus sp. L1K30]|uniref:ABC transporter substrate-binding protein n=1 Tax=Azoarcus sp. L1K30 TaxID=2820277 RepID=UPI001B8449A5|nr:ABC transporter substrate binding protein [Azoarcus sp. L1K30]MBR0565671.1 hypothetical protein [Azoarcus sp. L1K30]
MDIAIVLSQSGGAHRVFAETLRVVATGIPHTLRDAGSVDTGVNPERLRQADLIIAVGARATQEVLPGVKKPVLSVLVSRAQYQSLSESYPDAVYAAMVLDHPASRHMRLASIVAPNIKQIGLLVGPDSVELEQGFVAAAADAGVRLTPRRVGSQEELLPQLEQLLQVSDALLMIPDPLVASQAAARTILLTSYRYRKPILAYSQAYVQAGALAAVFSAPDDVARDLADWLRSKSPANLQKGTELQPQRFSVAVNRQVARALGMDVPSDEILAERVAGGARR